MVLRISGAGMGLALMTGAQDKVRPPVRTIGAPILQPQFSGKVLLPIKNENALDSRNQLAEISSKMQ